MRKRTSQDVSATTHKAAKVRAKSEEGDNIVVGFKQGKQEGGLGSSGGKTKRKYGDISFWLADRKNRESGQWLRPEKATRCDGKENCATNTPPDIKDNITVNGTRKVTSVRRILSHVEIILPPRTARKSSAPSPVTPAPAPPVSSASSSPVSPASSPPAIPVHLPPVIPVPASRVDARMRTSGRSRKKVNYQELPLDDDSSELSDSEVYLAQVSEHGSEPEEDAIASADEYEPHLTESEPEEDVLASVDESESHLTESEVDDDLHIEKKRKVTKSGAGKSVAAPAPTEDVTDTEVGKKKKKKKKKNTKERMAKLHIGGAERGIKQDMPPISSIGEIFADITRKAVDLNVLNPGISHNLKDVIARLGTHRLRVATMCSGTESPLLAIEMIRDSLKDLGIPDIQIDHVFSAEIEPFKQAYIERNFHPPIIFRDIVEITNSIDGKATTAYGARVAIPKDVDMIIAGTACVDFSQLNNQKKALEQNGESGDTFHAVLEYAKHYRPSILVLENVFNAPWDEMMEDYEAQNYACNGATVDTKHYYLPQTRQRGYMVCFDKTKSKQGGIPDALPVKCDDTPNEWADPLDQWVDVMKELKRPVSSPVSSFLLPNDDIDIIRSRQTLARKSLLDGSIRDVDWAKCQIRHSDYRREKELGNDKPMTDWQQSGILVVPEYSDRPWYKSQVERVWDFIDMSLLRKAIIPEGGKYDVQYKTRVWDVSQNIDRFTDTAPFGVASCLTPSGIFFITDRGGPLTYTESLVLQGLPLSKISFTTETERQIQDLAGNAMSSPVVGAAIVASLIAGYEILPEGPKRTSQDQNAQSSVRIVGTEELKGQPQKPGHEVPRDMAEHLEELLADAARSSRKCHCEGRVDVAERAIKTCKDCDHTSCITCGVKPLHVYQPPEETIRDRPEHFIQKWRPRFPMLVRFGEADHLGEFFNTKTVGKKSASEKAYIEAVAKATRDPLAFKEFRRLSYWVVTYESPSARLELILDGERSAWKFFAKPDPQLPGKSDLRKLLQLPIAKSAVNKDAFFGKDWDWHMPATIYININIKGEGKKMPSWSARIGLPLSKDEKVWSRLRITSARDHDLSQDISGVYEHLPDCGTACDSLYKRVDPADLPSLYLFLDPTRIGDPKCDTFVFASDHSRMQYDQTREIVAALDPKWRPWDLEAANFGQVKASSKAKMVHDKLFSLGVASPDLSVAVQLESLLRDDCSVPTAIASCEFSVPFDVENRFLGHRRIQPDDKAFFETFGWALESLRQGVGFLKEEVGILDGAVHRGDDDTTSCKNCAPLLPAVRWNIYQPDGDEGSTEIRPYEDPKTATGYEVALKARPRPLIVESSIGNDRRASINIGVNALSVCHRAAGKLLRLTSAPGSVAWSLDTGFINDIAGPRPTFNLRSNGGDASFDANFFKIDLFEKQKQSLTWMIDQEAGPGKSFVLEETEEALLPHLGWRLEAQATATVHARGGILADHPGFGKTITSLALIHSEFVKKGSAEKIKENMKDLKPDVGQLVVPRKIAATLVICPLTLITQWKSEVMKVLGTEYKYNDWVISIAKTTDLDKYSVKEFENARIILVSRSVLENENYRKRLALFGGVPECTSKGDREVRSWLKFATRDVPKNLQTLQNEGVKILQAELKEAYSDHMKDDTLRAFAAQSKRLKGRKYTEKKKAGAQAKETSGSRKDTQPALDRKELSNCLLFEMFHFNRIVVDEFSYMEPKDVTTFGAIKADKRWGLSATPRLKDPYDVSRMANLLGLKLPIGASAPGLISGANMKALRKGMTNVEQFETFRDSPSRVIQERVHGLAQQFLDVFVRQNVLEFNEWKYKDSIVPVKLNADHRIVYTDISQRLSSQEMRIRKGAQAKNDNPDGKSTSGEEILVKAAALFTLKNPRKKAVTESDSEIAAYDIIDITVSSGLQKILQNRSKDLVDAKKKLQIHIDQCRDLAQEYSLEPEQCPFKHWVDGFTKSNILGDQSATDEVKKMIGITESDTLGDQSTTKDIKMAVETKPSNKRSLKSVAKKTAKNKGKTAEELTEAEKKMKADLKIVISRANQTAKAYVAALRSTRFVKNAEAFDRFRTGDPLPTCEATGCDGFQKSLQDQRVSAACGHVLCKNCFEVSQQSLSRCTAEGCENEVRPYHLLHPQKMGDGEEGTCGRKATSVVKLLHQIAEKDEQAILFVQYDDQINQLRSVLRTGGINYAVNNGPEIITKFQTNKNTETKKTVLIINSSDVSAAGTNLVNANHVIFFSPVLKESQYEYDAQMAQGVGRVRRPGQSKDISVYRMITLDTIDVDILEQRERRTTIMVEIPAEDDAMDIDQSDGGMFNGDNLTEPEKSEPCQLTRDPYDQKIKLVPRSILLRSGLGVEGKDRVKDLEDFSSSIKFSKAFANDD